MSAQSSTPSEESFDFIPVPIQVLPRTASIPVEPVEQYQTHASITPGYIPGSSASSYAHNWTTPLSVRGRHLVDSFGRVCLPRGVDISGSSKIPNNHDPSTFPLSHREVSFLNRPFPLEDAPEHFARLRRWGLTFVRMLVTWEAIEHAGPGQYDQNFLEYLYQLLRMMSNFGIFAYVSMHQDVWSRYSGGSGAPAWTLEAVGFDLTQLEATGAAYLGGVMDPGRDVDRGRWPTGYQKLASSTMWTCFWAGDIFAPKLEVIHGGERIGIQAFLQSRFLQAFDEVAKKVGNLESVIGFELMNEPHRGYIGLESLHTFDYYTELHLHDCPTALQSFALGAGHSVEVVHYVRSWPFPTRPWRRARRNEENANVWRTSGPTQGRCLWEMHAVWDWDERKDAPVALRENYFWRHPVTHQPVNWYKDSWYPFVTHWASRIALFAGPRKLIFVEGIPNELSPPPWPPHHRPKNFVFAPHWYDLQTLFTKTFGNLSYNVQKLSSGTFPLFAIYWGVRGVRNNYSLQIRNIAESGYRALGEVPIIVGECGVPMDLNGGAAFRSGDFRWQRQMMDAMLCGLERNLLSFNLWNYNPDNTDEKGDHWNGENFSWFSNSRARSRPFLDGLIDHGRHQNEDSLDEGGRLLDVIVRPYPAKVAGIPLSFEYDSRTGAFAFSYANPTHSMPQAVRTAPTVKNPPLYAATPLSCKESEIFVPSALARGRRMIVKLHPSEYVYDEERQTMFILHRNDTPGAVHTVQVKFEPPLAPVRVPFFSLFFMYFIPMLTVLLAMVGHQLLQ
ncbi:glycoside hydrolase family 5 protein [Cantharellus anzutake]|uniref:glycoside hydrolase family 5 protein n=1 Tax=Cantharellus anzutake TaxID=1750568 RepID=UPI001903A428|nr:glycoside hydrolase family 5 protein [Cantharellus anzutake]KAF8328906.1 glycoside hydrolase family 5 protein [Cantharellus anzutake]